MKDTLIPANGTPITERRQLAYAKSKPETQEMMQIIANHLGRANVRAVSPCYLAGQAFNQVQDEPHKHVKEGETIEDVLGRIATFVDYDVTRLRELGTFANAFDADYVKSKLYQDGSTDEVRLMANGRAPTLTHWLYLSRIESEAHRKQMVDKVYAEGYTTDQLLKETLDAPKRAARHGGGRKPSVPKTPAAGVAKLMELSKQMTNYVTHNRERIFTAGLLKTPKTEVTPALLDQARAARQQFLDLASELDDTVNMLNKFVTSAQAVVEEPEDDEEDDDVEEASKAPTRKARTSKKPARSAKGAAKSRTKARAR